MQTVDSKYRSFPWAFVYPTPQDGQHPADLVEEVNRWLVDNDQRYNRDYLNFEIVDGHGRNGRQQVIRMGIAFKDRSKALMFKIAWA